MSKKNSTLEADIAQPVDVEETQALATVEAGGELALNDMYEADAGAGLEDMGSGDVATPFLSVLQKGSPQVDETDKRYIAGARPGMILNTLTGELYDGKTGIRVIACGYQKLYTEWTPRDSGGGFKGHHHESSATIATSTVDDKGKRHATNGNLLVDTAYYFVLAVPDSGPFQAMVSMSSTQLKKSRKWNSLMKGILLKKKDGRSFNPPMFSHAYLLKTEPESNDQGSWYGWNITADGMVTDRDLYDIARAFNEQVKSGTVRTGPPPQDGDAATTGDVPF